MGLQGLIGLAVSVMGPSWGNMLLYGDSDQDTDDVVVKTTPTRTTEVLDDASKESTAGAASIVTGGETPETAAVGKMTLFYIRVWLFN